MAREKQQPDPEIVLAEEVIAPQPTLSAQTLAEMEAGRKQAEANTLAMEAALRARAEEERK